MTTQSFILFEDTRVFICNHDINRQGTSSAHKPETCTRCKPLWILPAGTYDTRLTDLVDASWGSATDYSLLDIVQSGGLFITDSRGPKYDWTVSFRDQGYKIESETSPVETSHCGYTITIGNFVISRPFHSFSLTDRPHSDEGHYNFVINEYRTPTDKLGIVLSGFQNLCDYPDYYDELSLDEVALIERPSIIEFNPEPNPDYDDEDEDEEEYEEEDEDEEEYEEEEEEAEELFDRETSTGG